MGVDLYLNSVWRPWFDAHQQILFEQHRRLPLETVDDLDRLNTAIYDSFRASGGYFRNAYNDSDVMWAMGLSWRNDVGKMLDADHQLPTDRARELIAKIEAHPLTRERIARHIFAHMTSGSNEHPVMGCITNAIDEACDAGPRMTPELDELSAIPSKRREQLLAILRKSVELAEPLVCDL
jgi:hypothetical protein